MFSLISHQQDIDKIHWYDKDPYETKYQFLINKQESTGIKHLNDSKAFIKCSNDVDFDDMIADMLSNLKT